MTVFVDFVEKLQQSESHRERVAFIHEGDEAFKSGNVPDMLSANP